MYFKNIFTIINILVLLCWRFFKMNDKIVYNPEKFKAVFSYIVSRCENKYNVGRTVLCKLLYFSDFNFFMKYMKNQLLTKHI